jgi:hypothetical protein
LPELLNFFKSDNLLLKFVAKGCIVSLMDY